MNLEESAEDLKITMQGSPLGIAWGFLYGYLGVKPENFMPQLRQFGSGFTKVYLLWNQIEPEKGRYDWNAVDTFVNQLESPEEGLISLFSSSQWAVKRPSALLPPSPAKDLEDYYRFVYDLVKHCRGRVRYWQNDAEPNNPVYWSGTKEEYVEQLKVFYRAVKDADPSAVVVVGGYDGVFNPPGMEPLHNQQAGLDFFDYILKEGNSAFDVFDMRLYADPYTISARVEFMRVKMLDLGHNKSFICTEYGGPNFFEFQENRQYIPLVASWSQSLEQTDDNGIPSDDIKGRNQITKLYDNMSRLAPQTQMFMQNCPDELQKKFERIQARDLVIRNIFALSSGVQKLLYWQLLAGITERDHLMTLMYGKIGLLGYEEEVLRKCYPLAEVYKHMAERLKGVQQVKQIHIPDKPAIFLFKIDFVNRESLYVIWERRDTFSGEDSPAVSADFPWSAKGAMAVDILGKHIPVELNNEHLYLPVSVTPIFVEPIL